MVMVGGILLILGVALAFTNYLVDAEVPQMIMSWLKEYITNPLFFLLMLNILLLALGAVLDIFSALVIMVPLLLLWPLVMGYTLSTWVLFFLLTCRLVISRRLLE